MPVVRAEWRCVKSVYIFFLSRVYARWRWENDDNEKNRWLCSHQVIKLKRKNEIIIDTKNTTPSSTTWLLQAQFADEELRAFRVTTQNLLTCMKFSLLRITRSMSHSSGTIWRYLNGSLFHIYYYSKMPLFSSAMCTSRYYILIFIS